MEFKKRVITKLLKFRESSKAFKKIEDMFLSKKLKLSFFAYMQKNSYLYGTSDHEEHNLNPDYWDILLQYAKKISKEKQIIAFDFGCGQGRNIKNLYSLHENVIKVDGMDLSEKNCSDCRIRFKDTKTEIFNNNGLNANDLKSNYYDFAMSTIVFQHIPVFTIRDNILKDIFRSLKVGGILSFQMGFGSNLDELNGTGKRFSYSSDNDSVSDTNGWRDVRVTDSQDLIKHLETIGFEILECKITNSFSDAGHNEWIYVHASKK